MRVALLTLLTIYLFTPCIALAKTCSCECSEQSKPKPPKPAPEPPKPPKPTKYSVKSSERLKDPSKLLPEISGIDVSLRHPNTFYAHNDSGGSATVYAIKDHSIVAQLEMSKTRARDFEDMTTAPCQKMRGSCIFIADFGDNNHRRAKNKAIYEVVEPFKLDGKMKVKPTKFGFTYEGGKNFNAEGFAYHPGDKHFYILTKGKNDLYKLPLPLKDGMVAKHVCKMRGVKGIATAFDIHESGAKMLVRSYGYIHEYRTGKTLGCSEPYSVEPHRERQGEAVYYLDHGRDGYVSVSEGLRPAIFKFEP